MVKYRGAQAMDMSEKKERPLPLVAIALIRSVVNTSHRLVYPFLPVLARGLGVEPAAMAAALMVRAAMGAAGPFLASALEHRSRRSAMVLGLALFSAGAAGIFLEPTYAVFILALALSSVGKHVFDPALQAWLGDRVPFARRGRAVAVTEMGWSLAFIAGVPLAGLLMARHGWRAPFPVLAGLGLLSAVAVRVFLPGGRSLVETRRAPLRNLKSVLSFRPALAGLMLGLLSSAANESVSTVFGLWLESSLGMQIAALGAASAVIGFSELGGESLVALAADRLGKTRAVGLGLAANTAVALALPFLGRTRPAALAGLFFFYLTFEFAIVSFISLMTEVRPGARATMMAFHMAFLSLGRALGAGSAAWLFGLGFWAVAAATAVLNLAALLCLRPLAAGFQKT